MSWNKNFVLVMDANAPDFINYFKGFDYKNIGRTNFNSISNKNLHKVSVGYLDGNIFITIPDHAHRLYSSKISGFEQWLVSKYPHSTILSLNEDGTGGCYGFSLIVNSKRVRIIYGCEDEVYFEFGEPIELERIIRKEVLDELSLDERDEILEDGEEALDEYIESESNWRLPYSYLEREHKVDIYKYSEENPEFFLYE